MQLGNRTVPAPDVLNKLQAAQAARQLAGAWLAVVSLGLLALILIGGLTRLTNSGLSITEWQPILGVVPPLDEDSWSRAFTKYQAIPQYRQVTAGISLADFKTLYWWEWTHRLIGRAIGFLFLVPGLLLAGLGKIDRKLWPRLIVIFSLGALQGVLGWWMVQSGLSERVSVSQYRLAAHLGLAVLVYGAVLWTTFYLLDSGHSARWQQRRMTLHVWSAIALTYVQMLLGALVAGLHAGLIDNSWPLMDGAWIPDGLFASSHSVFEDPTTVQFDHRLGAYLVLIVVLSLWFRLSRCPGEHFVRNRVHLAMLLAITQFALGIATLVEAVPLPIAAFHQGGAILLFTALLWLAHGLTRHG